MNSYALNPYEHYPQYYPGSSPPGFPYNLLQNRPPFVPSTYPNYPRYPPYQSYRPITSQTIPYPAISRPPFGISSLFSASAGFGESNIGPGESGIFGVGNGLFGPGLMYPGEYGNPQHFGSFNYPAGTLLPNGNPIAVSQGSGPGQPSNPGFFNRFGLRSIGSGIQNGLYGIGRSIGRSILRRTFGDNSSTTTESTISST